MQHLHEAVFLQAFTRPSALALDVVAVVCEISAKFVCIGYVYGLYFEIRVWRYFEIYHRDSMLWPADIFKGLAQIWLYGYASLAAVTFSDHHVIHCGFDDAEMQRQDLTARGREIREETNYHDVVTQ